MHEQLEQSISCPYCGESIEILIDSSSELQEYFEDCSVCCAPILFSVAIDSLGSLSEIIVRRDDD